MHTEMQSEPQTQIWRLLARTEQWPPAQLTLTGSIREIARRCKFELNTNWATCRPAGTNNRTNYHRPSDLAASCSATTAVRRPVLTSSAGPAWEPA